MISKYSVTGMTCGHCVNHVTEEVSAVPGVEKVEVTLDGGGAMTITSAEAIDLDTIKAAVAEAGDYEVTPA